MRKTMWPDAGLKEKQDAGSKERGAGRGFRASHFALSASRFRRSGGGFTLIEVLIALFIMLMGVVGVLAAMPTAVSEAEWVVFQDAAINLAHSKFAEFRRDRMDPSQPSWDQYLNSMGTFQGETSVVGGDPDGYRPFLSPTDTQSAYYYFDNIQSYCWKVDVSQVTVQEDSYGRNQPQISGQTGGAGCNLVTITVRVGGPSMTQAGGHKRWKTFKFKQIMTAYQ